MPTKDNPRLAANKAQNKGLNISKPNGDTYNTATGKTTPKKMEPKKMEYKESTPEQYMKQVAKELKRMKGK